jgi:ATP-dependent Lon protease
LAAARSGVRTVVLPDQNRKDLAEVPAEIRKKMQFRFAKTIDAALKLTL